jgi:hypothetical protein
VAKAENCGGEDVHLMVVGKKDRERERERERERNKTDHSSTYLLEPISFK